MSDQPVVCTLSPEALNARRQELLFQLIRRAETREELPLGHRLKFAADDDILGTIARAVAAERQCCRFLRFVITVEPDGGPVTLEFTGPAGTREFLSALLDA